MELTPSEKDLLLCAARSAAGRVDPHLTNAVLRCRLDLARAIRAAHRHGMIPLLRRHLKEVGAEPLPAEAAAQLEALLDSDGRSAAALCADLSSLAGALERAGIRAAAFKGPGLAVDLYGDASLGSPANPDLLIRLQDMPRAVEVLEGEGFVPQPRLSAPALAILTRSECGVRLARARPPLHVELRWNIVPPCIGVRPDLGGMIGRGREVVLGPGSTVIPSAEDLLVCLCIDGAQNAWTRLEEVTAVSVLCGRPLDWQAVIARSREWRALPMVLLGLGIARELLESEPPAPVLDAMRLDPALRRLTRRACLRIFELRTPMSGVETGFRLRTLDGSKARLRYMAHRAFAPTVADVEWLGHRRLSPWLYGIVRPLRLAVQATRARVTRAQATESDRAGDR